MTVTIPKIIHQTYKSLDKLPPEWKETPDQWKRYHPEWTYMFWSDSDCRKLVKENFPEFLETFDSYENNIQRADAIRPIVLYLYGGFYADMDVIPIEPLDKFFYPKGELFLVQSPNSNPLRGKVITNSMMGSKKGCIFWKIVIEEMMNRFKNKSPIWSLSRHIYIMYSTGPMLIDDMVRQYGEYFDIHLLPDESFFPSKCDICSEKPCFSSNSSVRVLEGSSWASIDTRLFIFISCNYKYIIAFIILIYIIYNFDSLSISDTISNST